MYWNWGLDWVISHGHITIIMVMNGVPICMGMVYWNGSYQMMHMKWSHGYGWCTPLWPDNHSCLVYTLQWSLMNPIQYPIPYHTTPRGNFVYKLGTKLSCSLEMREAGPMVMVMVVKDDWYEEIAFLCMCLIISVSVFINSWINS